MNSYLISSLENAIQRLLALHPEHLNYIKKHEGKLLKIQFKKPAFPFILHIQDQRFHIYFETFKEVNACIKTTPLTLLRILRQSKTSYFSFRSSFEIEGDIDFCQDLFHTLKNIEFDWIEYLSHFTNDTIATVVEQAFDKIKRFSSNAIEQWRVDSEEYLKYETNLLPNPHEITHFLNEVDCLVNDVARFEVRIKHLEQMR